MWACVGPACSGHQTHGVVSPAVINAAARTLGVTTRERDAAVEALSSKIWHPSARAKRCGPCAAHMRDLDLAVPKGSFLWHGWNDQPWDVLNLTEPTEKL